MHRPNCRSAGSRPRRAAGRGGPVRIGRLSEREFLVAGVSLYAGEGGKTDGEVRFANTHPRMIAFHCAWLRRFFEIDEARHRAVPDPAARHSKHVHGCVSIGYSCSATHRSIMGLVSALLGDAVTPG
jgi:hypothetical protein